MRRIISFLLLSLVSVLCFVACGVERIKIEDYEWKMRFIMHAENNQVIYDAAGEEHSASLETTLIDMTLVAMDGKITITDATNNKTYQGTYTVSGKHPKGADYHITIDGKSGYAGVAMTTYVDGTEEPTLPISLDGYSMYFYAE